MRVARPLVATRLWLIIAALIGAMIFPAHAIVKCSKHGSVEYTDGECANAHPVLPTDLRQSTSLNVDRAEAAQRAAAEKAELIRLENTRHISEHQTEKLRQRQASAQRLRQQHCATLLLRKKWLEEDRRATTSRSHKSISKKTQRLAEKYTVECGS